MGYGHYFLSPRYWIRGLQNPIQAWDNFMAVLKHPLIYMHVCGKVEGLIDHYLGMLLYDCVIVNRYTSRNIVEVGAYKGLSTVYLSLAAAKTGKRIKSFELFSGLPVIHPDYDTGYSIGQFSSEVSEYETNVNIFGNREVVDLITGDARQTMLPVIKNEGFSLAFLDVDVYDVMRELLFQLWSIARGYEVIIVHDAHSPGIRQALNEFHNKSRNRVKEYKLHKNAISRLEFPKSID